MKYDQIDHMKETNESYLKTLKSACFETAPWSLTESVDMPTFGKAFAALLEETMNALVSSAREQEVALKDFRVLWIEDSSSGRFRVLARGEAKVSAEELEQLKEGAK